MKVIIVGAGFGGISAAALLAKAGHDVTVLEKTEMAGGRARVWKEQGFVYDLGPSWYLMPEVFEYFFSKFNKKPDQYYQLKRIDPNYRVFFGEETRVDFPADVEKVYGLFDAMENKGGEKLRKYLKTSSFMYNLAMKDFIYKEYKSIFDFFNWDIISKGPRLHLFESIDRFARRYFKNEKLRQVLEYTMVFLGGAPHNTPALYSIMSHVDFNLGVWYPMGGLGALVEGLKKLAEENGAKFIFDQNVKKIEVLGDKAKRVLTDKLAYEADLVLVNADYHHAETELLSKENQTYPESYWSKKKIGPSAFLIYLGLNKRLNGLLHHNLYLDPSWDAHFKTIFEDPRWPENFSYYVSCPSQSDPSVAPEGKENLFILVPVAPGLEDTEEIRNKYFDRIIAHLGKLLGENIRDSIQVKRTYAHNDFSRDYNSYQGTALGMSHTLFQTAVFRPAHKSKKVSNLFYTGNYCHPGIGVPMVIISSQIVCDEILKQNA